MKTYHYYLIVFSCLFTSCQKEIDVVKFVSEEYSSAAEVSSTKTATSSHENALQANIWTISNPLNVARSRHTTSVLASGKVLVAGGYTGFQNNPSSTATYELYDQATETWDMVTSVSSPRANHTATVLANGKVLVTGGRHNNNALASAELYDATTGLWIDIEPMNYPRFFHTATLLENGKVLVTGGLSGEGFSIGKTAEIYDPAIGSWTLVDHMSIIRWGHSATLLENGKVLVAGGSGPAGDGIYTLTAETYDPFENVWRNVGHLNTPRGFHGALRLADGTVLVAGGLTMPSQQGNVTITAEIYNPGNEKWTYTGSMAFQRIPGPHGCVLMPDGQFFAVGGRTATSEQYNLAYDSWTVKASLNIPRSFHTVTLLPGGTVITIGGENRNGFVSAVEQYISEPEIE